MHAIYTFVLPHFLTLHAALKYLAMEYTTGLLSTLICLAVHLGRTGVRKGAYVGYVMNAVRYPVVGQSTVTSTKYKRAGIALLPFGSASILNCQSQLLIGSLIVWSNACLLYTSDAADDMHV